MGLFDFLRFRNKPVSDEHISDDINSVLFLPEMDRQTEIPFPPFYSVSKHMETEEEKNNINTAYFKNGVLFALSPRTDVTLSLDEDRQVAYNARFIVSDNIKYDLFNPSDLAQLSIPIYKQSSGSFPYITRDLSYILNMRAKRTFCAELAIPLVYKTISMMIRSGWGQKRDFDRLIAQLEGLNENKHVQNLKREIENCLPFMSDPDYYHKLSLKKALQNAETMHTDLLEVPYLGCSCEECAKYQGRVYSISGKDKRFPALPNQVFYYGGFHVGCHHSFFPIMLFDGASITKNTYDKNGVLQTQKYDAIHHSNRPFIDDRSLQEKEAYHNSIKKSKQESDDLDQKGLVLYIKRAAEYYWLQQYLPNLAPKSIGAYTRMKHTQSKKYLTIKSMAKDLMKDLDDTL